MADPLIVMLTEGDMELARRLAAIRNNPKAESGNVGGLALNKGTTLDAHFDGARAEVACCKHFGFPPDVSYYSDGDKHRPDLYVGDIRCKVKACLHRPPILKFNNLTEFYSDVAIVCVVNKSGAKDQSIVELWGCISRRKFLSLHKQRDFGHGVRAVVEHTYLAPVSVLTGSTQSLAWLTDYDKAA